MDMLRALFYAGNLDEGQRTPAILVTFDAARGRSSPKLHTGRNIRAHCLGLGSGQAGPENAREDNRSLS